MNGATAADRRALVERARNRLTKTRAPGMTRVGVHVLVDLAAADLDAAIAIDEKASRTGPRTGRRVDGGTS